MRTRTAVAGLALVLTACSPLAQPSPSTTPKPGTGAAATLEMARAAFFGNRYSEAEDHYRAFLAAHPASAEGHADFALFLNYRHHFPEALGEATQAVSLDPRSGIARAVDTRVHDWAATPGDTSQLKDARDRGAEAIKVAPTSALAHTFYSETLADTGDGAGSRREVDVATRLAATDYERAEVEREQGNLASSLGDPAGQLKHLKAAQAIQPNWIERVREVAQYYFANGPHGLAVSTFRSAIALAPDDAELRISLGALAIGGPDFDIGLAAESFDAANGLRPHDSDIESVMAMTHFALHHDVADAERLLRQAVADAPRNLATAELLEGFLRYVKKDAAGADQVRVGTMPLEPLNPRARFPVSVAQARRANQQVALDTLNGYRKKAGLASVAIDDRISQGAASHDYWWLFNLSLPEATGLGIHREVPGTPGFTGVQMVDRARHFGYPGGTMTEDITHAGEPAAAISQWVDSVYHRFPIMVPQLTLVGFADAFGAGLPIETLDMGYSGDPGSRRQTVAYPADGQDDIPIDFVDNELPDPIPAGEPKVSGYPVTLNFNIYALATVGTAEVRDAAGNKIDSYFLPPSRGELNVLTLLPKAPLHRGATYKVHVSGAIDGVAFTRDWAFQTTP